jgi:hypothetical protein
MVRPAPRAMTAEVAVKGSTGRIAVAEPTTGQEGRRFDHGKNGRHGRNAGGRQGGATRQDVKPCRIWPAFRFRVLPRLPWTILFNEGLSFAITFGEDQYLGTEGRRSRRSRKPATPFAVFSMCSNDDHSRRLKHCRFSLFAPFESFCSRVFSGSIDESSDDRTRLPQRTKRGHCSNSAKAWKT